MQHNTEGMKQNMLVFNAENIGPGSVTSAVDLFYNEINLWNFDNPVQAPENMHFSNMIWKNAKKMGIGCATMVRSGNKNISFSLPSSVAPFFSSVSFSPLHHFFLCYTIFSLRSIIFSLSCHKSTFG